MNNNINSENSNPPTSSSKLKLGGTSLCAIEESTIVSLPDDSYYYDLRQECPSCTYSSYFVC
jgi:hypothetical protein